jgi:PAS domain S-box-containing protein
LKARFLSGDYAEALAASNQAKEVVWAQSAQIVLLDYFCYTALTIAALYDKASADEQAAWRDLLTAHRKQLSQWAENYPPTFGDKVALVSAEIARVGGRDSEAMHLYEDAIRSARAHGFVLDEGIAHEVAARFYAARGFDTIADVYLRSSMSCFDRVGAEGKSRQLQETHPQLRDDLRPTTTFGATVEQLDIDAVVKASQAISGEIVLDRLVETLMTIALQHAGAERGLLIVVEGETLQIVAGARTDRDTVEITLRQESVASSDLPTSLLHTVIRTRQSVIVDDASAQNPFSADEYFRQKRARSVLCIPLVKQTALIGALYLENNLAPHVFTPARLSVLNLLSSQVAISLDNARLYAALRTNEERWRNLFENAPVGIALAGSDKRYTEVNPAFQRMTGYSEAELRRTVPADITHEEDRAQTEGFVEAWRSGGEPNRHLEKRYRRKDGGVVWGDVSTFLVPQTTGGPPLMAAVIVDITDRKRAEAALRTNEERWRNLFENAPVGIALTGSNQRYAEVNPAFQRMTGYSQAELRRLGPADITHEEDRAETASFVGAWWRGEDATHHIEKRYRRKDGGVVWGDVSGFRLAPVAGGTPLLAAVVVDITDRKRAEDNLREVQAELAHVARVTTMGEMAASIAHEVNQPLSGVVINGNACLRWMAGDSPNMVEAREAVQRIIRDGKRASEVIARIRNLSKKSGADKEPLDLNETIVEVVAFVQGELRRARVTLRTDLADNLPTIIGDRVQLQQVVLNLVLNGLEAMATVADRPRELAIETKREDAEHVCVAVRDVGVGLDTENINRVFDAFYTTKHSGMGLGLSISRSIIENHGGRLWAVPNEGPGATFQFTV